MAGLVRSSDGTAAADQDVRVAVVTDIGGLNDKGFNNLANAGLQRADKQLDVDGRIYQHADRGRPPAEPDRGGPAGVRPRHRRRLPDCLDPLDNGCDDVPEHEVRGHRRPYGSSCGGERCRASRTSVASCSRSRRPAVSSATSPRARPGASPGGRDLRRRREQGAGDRRVHRRLPVLRPAGEHAASKVLVNYANDPTFADQAKCKATALSQIARGSNVVFQVAGQCGLGALDAAKSKKVWGIGVDADQSFLGRAHPDERDEEGRRRPSTRLDRGGTSGIRALQRRHRRDLQPQEQRRRLRQAQPEAPARLGALYTTTKRPREADLAGKVKPPAQ